MGGADYVNIVNGRGYGTCGCDNISKLQEHNLPSEDIVIKL